MSDLMRRESRFRSPLASVLGDGEKWMVGFDDMFNRLVSKWEDGFDGFHEYPASNIKRIADDKFRIELAVAGFNKDNLTVEVEDETLIVKGHMSKETKEEKEDYLQRGIHSRNFEQKFQLAEHDQLLGAVLKNGILEIDVKREMPRPRKHLNIPVHNG
jgi:molecular chaperone IbpA